MELMVPYSTLMGIHESGWGKSSLSIDKNNLFGMNATDNNPYGKWNELPIC